MDSRVFVLSPIAKDIESARDFGDIFYVFNTQLHRAHTLDMSEIVEHMVTAFKEYDPEKDYFLPVGNTVLNCIANTVLSEVCGGRVHFLFWEPKQGEYLPLFIDLWGEVDKFVPSDEDKLMVIGDAMFGKENR